MKAAMKAKDKAQLEALRAIKSAILLAKTEKGGQEEMTEADELKLLQKLQKQRQDALDIYTTQGREDLAETETKQMEVIQKFLPEPLSEKELKEYLKQLIEKLQASGPQDMGKVMGIASKELTGKAEGKAISAQVKELLNP